jgi:protein transport protein SEC24
MPSIFLFLIDISIKSQENDFINTVTTTLSSIISSKVLPGHPRTEVSLMFFDKSVHFVSFADDSVSIITESDSGELFLPVPSEHLLVSIEDAEEKLIRALDLVKSLPSVPYSTGYRSALRAAGLVLQNQGGKVISFCGEMLCESAHPLQFTFKQSNTFYESIGSEYSYWNISLSQYVKTSAYCNLQGLMTMSSLTGGQVFFYPNFSSRSSAEKLKNEVIMGITTLTAWECSLKVRHSVEWRIVQSFGNFNLRPDGLFGIPVYNYPQSYAFELTPINVSLKDFYIQTALLYTNCEGERKLRIHNRKFNTSESVKDLLFNANCDALVNFICKKALFQMIVNDNPDLGQTTVESLSKEIMLNCIRIWGKEPERLEFFCASVLGLVKHQVFQNKSFGCNFHSDNLNLDLFFYFKFLFNSLSADESGVMIYPRLYPIHESFSRVLNLTYMSLEGKGAYLLDTGIEMFVWVGKVYLWT